MNYHFEDFTQHNYLRLLKIAKQKFEFCNYKNFKDKSNFVLWRHDLDYSVDYALKCARIEHGENISATYFIHLHSQYYNPLESKTSEKISEIINLGHHIGLHFDSHYYGIDNEQNLNDYISFEAGIIDKIFHTDINVFSFHNSSPFTLSCHAWKYGGLINTYAGYFKDNVPYCSDSCGYWRYKRLEDVLKDENIKTLQVLTHPEWWQEQVRTPLERIRHIVGTRAEDSLNDYETLIEFNGMKDAGW